MIKNSIRTAALAVATIAIMSLMTQDANAQNCRNGGFGPRGVSGVSISIGRGGFGVAPGFYGGFNNFGIGGFGHPVPIRTYRPSHLSIYSNSFVRPGFNYGFYGRPSNFYRHGYRHW